MPQCVPPAGKTPPEHFQKVQETLGGLQLTYTGTIRFSDQAEQKRSVERLASGRSHRVPDAKRVMPQEVKDKRGILGSYQWSGGGNPAKGFMH